jgi:hypothetical protein
MESEKLGTSKILAVDGIAPTNETIADGTYPYTNDFYVVIRKDAAEDSPEEPMVCTMLFSRIESRFRILRMIPMEMTAAGIDADTVIPTRSPR